ncbi:hypothetical protein Tco_0814218, partial [Tanacetum coccineum]
MILRSLRIDNPSAGNSEETITTDVGVSHIPENADNNAEVECAINTASKKQCVRNRGNNVLSSSSSSCVASVSHDSSSHVDSLLRPLARSENMSNITILAGGPTLMVIKMGVVLGLGFYVA